MVLDPESEKVDVGFIVVLSFIPIACLYAAWRIQKFWVIFGLSLLLETIIIIPFFLLWSVSFLEVGVVLSLVLYVALNVLMIKHYAERYNEKIEEIRN